MILATVKRTRGNTIGFWFENFSKVITRWTGSTPAFGLALITIIVWGASGPLFHFSNTWQLAINTSTTIVTFLMDVESLSEEELTTLHRYYGELAKLSRHATTVTESHSVEEARQRHTEKLGTPRKHK